MKKHIRLMLVAALVLPLTLTAVAAADTQTSTSGNTNSGITPKTGTEGLSLQQRLDKRKAEIKAKLNAADKTKVTTRCKAAQAKLTAVESRAKTVETSRFNPYATALKHQQELVVKLKAKGLDTTTYEQQLTVLAAKVQTYADDLATYKESVKDTAELDCVADPDAFKASLETSRTLRAKVVADGKDIRSYYTMTIKPTLLALRQQLINKDDTQNTGRGM